MSVQLDLRQPFRDCGFEGSITVFDYKQGKWITSDSTDSRVETVPASTFKIPNLLIALETGVIDSEMDTVDWVGSIDPDDTVKIFMRVTGELSFGDCTPLTHDFE